MPLLTESDVRVRGKAATRAYDSRGTLKAIVESQSAAQTYDVFLSHSFKDYELILGLVEILKGQGLSVYVDWLEDPTLDRNNVTSATAAKLRSRMKSCKSLIFATSDNSVTSKWMPWELGFFDGSKPDKVSILPISQTITSVFSGQEYLGLYPHISIDTVSKALLLNRTSGSINLSSWVRT